MMLGSTWHGIFDDVAIVREPQYNVVNVQTGAIAG